MARKKTTTADFEKSLEQLESIISKMENGELSLDESLKLFEEGVELTRYCHTALQQAEERISVLTQKNEQWLQAETGSSNDS